ncbi:MAG: hypothetical protein ACOCXP_01150 [Candidatus Dojkabacteria bacterium]
MAKETASTQEHLDIEDVIDDLVVLKNGNISLVIETDSLNFELLAEEEQDARILSFASLLNSVKFPMQIVIRTERADLNDYLDRLNQYREKEQSEALKRQMEIYIKFIRNLTVKTDVLNKRFFVVIPKRFVVSKKSSSLIGGLFGQKEEPDYSKNIQIAKEELYPKRDLIIKQFKKIGINAWQLKKDDLIQLYYDIYDPDKVGVRRVDVSDTDYFSGVVSGQPANTTMQKVGNTQVEGQGSTKGAILDDVMQGT